MAFAKADTGQQMMYTMEEVEMIKGIFGNNEKLLKLLRKIFLPAYDPSAPLGQTIDLWLAATDLKQINPMDAYQLIMARNMVIAHIEARLQDLNFLTMLKEETPEQIAEREKKDSTK